MNATNLKIEKKTNGAGIEIIRVIDTQMMKNGFQGVNVFTTKTSTSNDEIRENAVFEIDYYTEAERLQIAEMVINAK